LRYYGNATHELLRASWKRLFFIVATITVALLWKRPKLTVMQQALSRYYGNAIKA
jgi:hypothetical protein